MSYRMIYLALICFCSSASFATAAEHENINIPAEHGRSAAPIPSRMSLQTNYARNVVRTHQNEFYLNTKRGIDTLYKIFYEGWKSFYSDSLRSKYGDDLDSSYYFPDTYVQSMLIHWAGGPDLNDDTAFLYVHKTFVLPALESDRKILAANPTSEKLQIISVPAWGNAIYAGAKYYRDIASFRRFYKVYTQLSDLFRTFPATDTLSVRHTRNLLRQAELVSADIEAKNKFYEGRADLATSIFYGGISKVKYFAPYAVQFGRTLAQHFAPTDTAKSFRIYDSIAKYIPRNQLAYEPLRQMYLAIDRTNGQRHYDKMLKRELNNTFLYSRKKSVLAPYNWNIVLNKPEKRSFTAAKFVLVHFWNTTSDSSIAEIAKLNALFTKITQSRPDIMLISVNTDNEFGQGDVAKVLAFCKKNGIRYPVAYDNQSIAEQLDVISAPTRVILNIQGRIIIDEKQKVLGPETFDHLLSLAPEQLREIKNSTGR